MFEEPNLGGESLGALNGHAAAQRFARVICRCAFHLNKIGFLVFKLRIGEAVIYDGIVCMEQQSLDVIVKPPGVIHAFGKGAKVFEAEPFIGRRKL